MKSLSTYINESSRDVKNPKFRKLMKQAGLEDVILVKADGYFYLTSDNDDVRNELEEVDGNIYHNSFNQYTPEEWVEEITYILKDTSLIKWRSERAELVQW